MTSATRRSGAVWFPLTCALLVGTAVAAWLAGTAWGRPLVVACCVVITRQAPLATMLRLPGSVLPTTPPLPVWGALLQVAVVVAVAERLLGWRLALAVGMAGHVLSTVAGRLLVNDGLLVAPALASRGLRDTGPSVFVLTLAVYVVFHRWGPRAGAAAVTIVLTGVVLPFQLAGAEHAVGALVAAGAAMVPRWCGRRSPARGRAPRELLFGRARLPGSAILRGAAFLAVAATVTAASWHTYHPLEATAVQAGTARPVAIQLRDAAVVPVSVDIRELPGAYLSRSPRCARARPPHAREADAWVWKRPLWVCVPPGARAAPLVVHYDTFGVAQTLRIRTPVSS